MGIKNSSYLVCAFVGTILVTIALCIYVFDPLELLIDKIFTLQPGTLFYTMWKNPAYDAYFKVYLFNATNSNEFLLRKEKLKLQEIGPYTYKFHLRNDNPTFHENGTLSYQPRRTLSFVRELSTGDPAEDFIIFPHFVIIAAAATLENSSLLLNMGISTFCALNGCKSFINSSVQDYLWDFKDPFVSFVKKQNPELFKHQDAGVLRRFMGLESNENSMTILVDPLKYVSTNPLLTPEEKMSIYHIVKFNGLSGLPKLGYIPTNDNITHKENTRCNLIEGAFDGLLFPRHQKPNRTFRVFRASFCKPFPMTYVGLDTAIGSKSYKYELSNNFLAPPEVNPENTCFCFKSGCLRKGLGSIAGCNYNAPLAYSQPHFLNGDPWLLQQFDGLQPNKTAHETFLHFHRKLGLPVIGSFRVQLNIVVGKTKVSLVKPFNNLILPITWVDTTIEEIPCLVYIVMKLLGDILPEIQIFIMYLFLCLGLVLIGCCLMNFILISRALIRYDNFHILSYKKNARITVADRSDYTIIDN